jgi:hypothetical protein
MCVGHNAHLAPSPPTRRTALRAQRLRGTPPRARPQRTRRNQTWGCLCARRRRRRRALRAATQRCTVGSAPLRGRTSPGPIKAEPVTSPRGVRAVCIRIQRACVAAAALHCSAQLADERAPTRTQREARRGVHNGPQLDARRRARRRGRHRITQHPEQALNCARMGLCTAEIQ